MVQGDSRRALDLMAFLEGRADTGDHAAADVLEACSPPGGASAVEG